MKASSDFIFTEEGNDAVNTVYICEVCVLQRLWRNGTSSLFFFFSSNLLAEVTCPLLYWVTVLK